MKEIIKIQQLAPGDENCENFAFVPYAHRTPTGKFHTLPSTTLIHLNAVTERFGFVYWTCECGTKLKFSLPLDSDVE